MKQSRLNFLLMMFTVLLGMNTMAQSFGLWRSTTDETGFNRSLIHQSNMPEKYMLYSLDHASLLDRLRTAPHESDVALHASTTLLDLPLADGTIETFRVVSSPVMDPALAAKYPGIHSFTGKGLRNPGLIARFDVSPYGMNALIFNPDAPTIYIDHIENSFYRVSSRDEVSVHKQFQCLTDALPTSVTGQTDRPLNANQPRLRKYRLALLSGAEFSLHFVQPADNTDALKKARVLAQQNAQITRANALFERDLSIRMILVANNDTIIYLNAATDPVSNATSPNQTQLENAINSRIGSANYDIGHTGTKGQDNGNAGCIGCVCRNGKGQAYTAYGNPSLLDFYVIDYLVHEMGHQMGGNHTFSYQTEGTGVNVEPGSGITVMGYAGITGNTDVSNHSIDHYHARTIGQITNYLYNGGGNGCAVAENNSNAIPTANAGRDYIIPRSTPFALSGSGTDADATDVLTYVWEQNDNKTGNGSSIPNSTFTSGPMFRAYSPKTIPTTLFPSLQYILNGSNNFTWEVLPSVTRNLNFVMTVRDNHGFGGGTASDNMIVSINGSTGPFLVSSPNTGGINWQATSRQEVRWSVANSNNAPVNCAKVKISLSTDGGNTWPHVLADSTVNDGLDTITVPNAITTQARIKIEAVGNIFFDISNANFIVSAPPLGFSFVTPNPITTACGANLSQSLTLQTNSNGGFTTPVVLTASGNPAGTTVTFNPSTVNPGSTSVCTIGGTNNIAPGNYTITVTGTAGALINTTTITLNVTNGAPPRFIAQPANVTLCEGGNANFNANATDALNIVYQWQVSTNGGTSYSNISGANTNSLTLSPVSFSQNGNLYRLNASAACGNANSNAALLTVNGLPTITNDPISSTVCVGSNITLNATATGSGLQYQWQLSENGGISFSNIIGANNASYSINNISNANDLQQYRVFVTGSCSGSDTSAAALLTLGTAPTISTQPQSQVLCEGDTLRLNTLASGNNIQFQWQQSTNDGLSYSDITGASSANYTFNGITPSMNGNRFRVIARLSGCALESTSSEATLTVKAKPAITTQPINDTACFNTPAAYSVVASGENLTYQWQVSTNGGNTFNDIVGAVNATLNIDSARGQNVRFRVIVSNECGNVQSQAAALVIRIPPTISNNGGQPSNASVCEGNNASFTVRLAGGPGQQNGVNYQWLVSTDGGNSFNNVPGANASNLTINNTTTSQSGNQYRVSLFNVGCPSVIVNSNIVNLTVNPKPIISLTASDDTVCSSSTVTLTAAGSGAITYAWSSPIQSTSNSVDIIPAVNPSNPTAAFTDTYIVTGISANGCFASDTVEVTALPIVTLSASADTVCSGSTVTLTASNGENLVWSPIPGNTTSIDVNPVISDLNPTLYATTTYSVTGTSSNGCRSQASVDVTAAPFPTVTLNALPDSVINVAGQTITLEAISSVNDNGTTWTWYNNNQVVSSGNQNIYNVTSSPQGTYYYKVEATSSLGCKGISREMLITIDLNDGIMVYPNPNKGTFQVNYASLLKLNSTNKMVFAIFDANGKRILTKQITTGQSSPIEIFNIGNVNSGIYIIVAYDNNGKVLKSGKVFVKP